MSKNPFSTKNPFDSGGGGDGSGGVTSYNDLQNIPSINGVPLIGNKTGDDLGIEGGGGIGEESDPVWTAEKGSYATSASVVSSIATHNTDTNSHDGVTTKVASIQGVIPATATLGNKLITQNDLTSGLNSVYVPGAMIYRGQRANEAEIQAITSPASGDYYQAIDTGLFWIFNGTEWQETSGLTDLSEFLKESDAQALLDKQSSEMEDEIKNILDDYLDEHSDTSSNWQIAWQGNESSVDTVITLNTDIPSNATDIMFICASTWNPPSISSQIFPADYTMLSGGTPYVANYGSNCFLCVVGDGQQNAYFVQLQLITENQIKIIRVQNAQLRGIYYRTARSNAVISYYKDPTILGGHSPDYEKQETIINALTNTPYIPTITNTSSTFTGTGAPYSIVKDGYYDVYVRFNLGTALDSSTQDGCIMLGLYVNGVQKAFSLPTAVSEGGKRYRWTVSAECHAGDEIQVYVRVEDAQNVDIEGYTTTWFYTPYRSNVLPATEAAFSQHTQNTDIHVTAVEKADFHAPEVSYTTEITLYETDVQIPHVQSPDGDVPLAPLAEVILHAQNDIGYWNMLQMAMNQITANQALATKAQEQVNDLLARVAVLEDAPAPDPEPVYDMTSALTLHTPALLGALGLEIGSINLIGSGWTAPGDGLIVVDGASTIGLLTPVWIAVNGVKADPSGTVVLTLLGADGASGEIKIAAGDVITQSGMGNITFYKRIS